MGDPCSWDSNLGSIQEAFFNLFHFVQNFVETSVGSVGSKAALHGWNYSSWCCSLWRKHKIHLPIDLPGVHGAQLDLGNSQQCPGVCGNHNAAIPALLRQDKPPCSRGPEGGLAAPYKDFLYVICGQAFHLLCELQALFILKAHQSKHCVL